MDHSTRGQELPEQFVSNVHTWPLEASDRAAFLASFADDYHRGLRLNHPASDTLLSSMAKRQGHSEAWPQASDRIPWAPAAYAIPDTMQPGTDPAHVAGLYYLQEPSAMLPAQVLAAQPGELVLDMCAAPGGKTSQIARDLQGQGLLIANDISERRALVLRRNVEQLGLPNVQVTVEAPEELADRWGASFDAILLDAPCSGEGMFRRDPQAIPSWAEYGPASSMTAQAQLLRDAARLLKPGGRLVYSTCTFNPEENEQQLAAFLQEHPDFEVQRPELASRQGIRGGLALEGLGYDPADVLRIWPQDGQGEGHFCALLVRCSADTHDAELARDPEWLRIGRKPYSAAPPKQRKWTRGPRDDKPTLAAAEAELRAFIQQYMTEEGQARFHQHYRYLRLSGRHIQLLPVPGLSLEGLQVLKFGLHAGELKGRGDRLSLVPAHNFLLALDPDSWRYALRWSLDDERITRVLKGETLMPDDRDEAVLERSQDELGQAAYYPLLADGLPFTWLKRQGSQLKNLFPPGWRR